jgi:CubicO group peptidase (beta-lactamase class C family)
MPGKLFNTINSPSVQYMIFNKNSIIYYHSSGYAITGVQKTESSTSYNLHSTTQIFTALAVLQLSEAGRIDLNAPVKKYLPEFQPGEQITVLHLLNFALFVKNYKDISWFHSAETHSLFNEQNSYNELLNSVSIKSSGTEITNSYAGICNLILGKLVERISFCSFEEYITKNIFQKLQPHGLSFINSNTNHAAKGYQKTFNLLTLSPEYLFDKERARGEAKNYWKPVDFYYTNSPAVNGIAATAAGLAAFLKEFLKKDSKLIPQKFLSFFFNNNDLHSHKPAGSNLFIKGKLHNFNYYTHTGTGDGFYSEIRIYPEAGLGSLILLNRTGLKAEKLLDKTDLNFLNIYNSHIEPDIYAEAGGMDL